MMLKDKVIKKELIGYLGASVAALCVDVAILMTLHYGFGLDLWLASAMGFGCGIVVIYRLSIDRVFVYRRYKDQFAPEFGWFLITGLLGLVFTAIAVPYLVDLTALPVLLAKAMVVGLVFSFNFVARKLVLFTQKAEA